VNISPAEQLLEKHSPVCVEDPEHSLPPFFGDGSLHCRCLVYVPLSHVTEHDDHVVHLFQCPSIGALDRKNR